MKKLLYLSGLSICLHTPYVVLAAESGITFDSSLFDETPAFGSLLALDETSPPTYDISASEEDMLLFFDEEDLFITATRLPQTLSKAPAVVSVITGDDIQNMGARNIVDVLNRTPGFHVTQGYYGKEEIEVRGIKTPDAEKIKILIDGHSVNDNYSGGAVWGFGNLNVDNVKRIEIIRGPGSALYGSNAFSGVINVITKTGADMEGLSVTLGGGSFNSRKLNLQAGKTFNDLDIALSFNSGKTDGDTPSFGADASGNTGDANADDKSYDVQLKVAYNDFTLNAKYVNRVRGDYLNVANANTDFGSLDSEQYFAEVGYSHAFGDSTEITAKTYVDHVHWESLFELASFGLIAGPGIKERTIGVEFQIDHKITENNLLTFGIMREQRDQYEVMFQGNFDPSGNFPGLFDSVRDISSLGNWNREEKRDISALYVQDVWGITDDLELTIGARRDEYSDFGSTTNPRVATVWAFADDWNLKLLYGKAFRAPSFEQLYNTNNPAVKGSDMDPETMETFELNISNTFREKTKTKLTYFRSNFEDQIRLVAQPDNSTMYQNSGGARIQGLELEMTHKYTKANTVYLNSTYQDARDWKTEDVLQDVAIHKGNIGFNHQFAGKYTLNSNLFISGERPRAKGDTRDDLPAYALVDVAFLANDVVYNGFGVRATVHNLFDKNYSDPAPQGTVENDYVREGINVMLEVSYKYK